MIDKLRDEECRNGRTPNRSTRGRGVAGPPDRVAQIRCMADDGKQSARVHFTFVPGVVLEPLALDLADGLGQDAGNVERGTDVDTPRQEEGGILARQIKCQRVQRVAGRVEQSDRNARGGTDRFVTQHGDPEDVLGRRTDGERPEEALEGRHACPGQGETACWWWAGRGKPKTACERGQR